MAKHKLVIWPNGANPPSRFIHFKCVKCTKGALTMPVEVVRDIVSRHPYWWDYLMHVAWGSWGNCREDEPQHLEQFERWRSELSPPTTPS